MGEPVTLFGEMQMERRDRLRKILLKAMEDGTDMAGTTGAIEVQEEAIPQNELFYTEGPGELLSARRRIADFSLRRAKARVESQKRKMEDPDEDEAAVAEEVSQTCKRVGTQFSELGDDRPLQSCAFSPDGAILATAGWGGALKLWSSQNCERKLVISQAHQERLTGLAWHPEACISASPGAVNIGVASADCTASLWSLEGKKLQTLQGHTHRLARCAFHPMGEHFGTASFDRSWILWDIRTGQAILEQEGHSRSVYALAFQGDGSLAVSGGLDAIGRVWDLRTGRSIHAMQGHAKGILTCDVHPNGYQVLTGSLDNSIRVWDLRKRECVYMLPAHRHLVSQVKFEHLDGHFFVSCSYDSTVKVWSSANFSLIKTLAGHENKVMCADICPDGSGFIASVSYDRTIKLWGPEDDWENEAAPMET